MFLRIPDSKPTECPHPYTFPLDPFQQHAISAISKDENVLVCAKTGSGKTLVGEYQIYHSLKKGKRVFYTTPIKSLSNQKFNDLKQHTLDNNLMRKFAIEAASLRFAPEEVNSRVEDLLRVSRLEDEGNNLWAVYNRVQENLTHDVRNPNMDIKLNQQLFTLAESYI